MWFLSFINLKSYIVDLTKVIYIYIFFAAFKIWHSILKLVDFPLSFSTSFLMGTFTRAIIRTAFGIFVVVFKWDLNKRFWSCEVMIYYHWKMSANLSVQWDNWGTNSGHVSAWKWLLPCLSLLVFVAVYNFFKHYLICADLQYLSFFWWNP